MYCWSRNASVLVFLVVHTTWGRPASPSGGPLCGGVKAERETPWDKPSLKPSLLTRPSLVEAGGRNVRRCLVSRWY